MTEQTIDFGGFGRKVIVNPSVPLQIMDIFCRNSTRVQATLLGKVYSSTIEILEVIPITLSQQNEIVKLDFAEHSRALQNIMNVYSRMQVIGVAVTNLEPDNNLASLHSMYSNKQSGFKAQGILLFPIILSIGTKINQGSQNIQLHAYSFNKAYKFCKDIMNIVAFQELETEISFGDSDAQSMTPLLTAFNDEVQIIPQQSSKQMIKHLTANLKQMKKLYEDRNIEMNMEQQIKIRRILDKLSTQHEFEMNELGYLLDYAGLQRRLSIKLNKFQKE